MKNDQPTDYDKPVAYDTNGRPLYAHPPTPEQQDQPKPQLVHMTRDTNPGPLEVSDEVKARHEESVKKYPFLNLSEGEFVINEVRRHPIGLFPLVGISGFMILLVLAGLIAYPSIEQTSGGTLPPFSTLIVPAVLLIILFALGGYIAVSVYLNNKFFLTNESVIQEIQTSLFARDEQTVSLINIEDASFRQAGILQTMFNYGSIRLSTEGDETTYRFNYVANPKKQIATLNNAVEAFKNGRPVVND
jgi:hypothetical protein